MYTRLGEATLKSGERMEVGVVLGPDADWLPRVVPFLGHKNPDTRAHIFQSLEKDLDRLENRYYVGTVDGRIVSQIMIVGNRGAGILGHVFTHPEERRKGACSLIMGFQMAHTQAEGFRVLCLGTGFDTHPYWIYHSYGFRGIADGSGQMMWREHAGIEEELFRRAPASVRDVRWDDWGYFDLLGFQPSGEGEELPRCPTMGLKAQGSLEGPFTSFQLRRQREPQIQAKALESETGATVGWGLLAPDTRWFRDVWLLDLHAHPHFTDRLPDLAASLTWPDAPVVAYLTEPRGPKAAALEHLGFRPAATLPDWLVTAGARRPVTLWRNG